MDEVLSSLLNSAEDPIFTAIVEDRGYVLYYISEGGGDESVAGGELKEEAEG